MDCQNDLDDYMYMRMLALWFWSHDRDFWYTLELEAAVIFECWKFCGF